MIFEIFNNIPFDQVEAGCENGVNWISIMPVVRIRIWHHLQFRCQLGRWFLAQRRNGCEVLVLINRHYFTYSMIMHLHINRGQLRSLWVGVLIALPSGAGVALSVLGT